MDELQRPFDVAAISAQQDELLHRLADRLQHGCIYGGSATTAPEARARSDSKPYINTQVTWTSPLTNKLLLEAGFSSLHGVWGGKESDPNPTHDLIRVTENCSTAAGCPLNGNIAGLTYRSQNWAHDIADTPRWQASAAYVTGAHSLKFGYQGSGSTRWPRTSPTASRSATPSRMVSRCPSR